MPNIKVKKLSKDSTLPTRGSEEAAGWDLYSAEDVLIRPGETKKVGTGLAFEIPKGTFGAIFARSGLATKQGLAPANKVGVCDSDYRGEYIVALHNHSDEPSMVHKGDRIAQLVLMPYFAYPMIEVDELEDTERGKGGFGSTGK